MLGSDARVAIDSVLDRRPFHIFASVLQDWTLVNPFFPAPLINRQCIHGKLQLAVVPANKLEFKAVLCFFL